MTRGLVLRATVVYLALRLVSTVLLVLASHRQVEFPPWTGPNPGYLDMTVLWDGTWYRNAAEQGYPSVLPLGQDGRVAQNPWAFYPAFPLAARFLMWLTGLSFPLVASTLAFVCGLAAAVLMVGLLARRLNPSIALATMAVWAAFPSSPSMQLAYSEGMAMLVLVVWLWFVVERQWWLTGVMSLVVGVTRPIAAPLLAVLLVALFMRWRDRGTRAVRLGEVVAGLCAVGLTVLGTGLWSLLAWWHTGSRTAYTDTAAAWRAGHEIHLFKGWIWITEWAFRHTSHPKTYAPILLAAIGCGLLVGILGPWARRLGPELRTWTLAYPAYLVLVLDPFTSVFRYALPLFPLGAVLIGGARAGPPSRWWKVRTAVLVGVCLLLQVAWIWKLLVFHPPSDYPP